MPGCWGRVLRVLWFLRIQILHPFGTEICTTSSPTSSTGPPVMLFVPVASWFDRCLVCLISLDQFWSLFDYRWKWPERLLFCFLCSLLHPQHLRHRHLPCWKVCGFQRTWYYHTVWHADNNAIPCNLCNLNWEKKGCLLLMPRHLHPRWSPGFLPSAKQRGEHGEFWGWHEFTWHQPNTSLS